MRTDLHDIVLVLAKPKFFVLTGQNTIAKSQKKFCFGFAKNKPKIVQVRLCTQDSDGRKMRLYTFGPLQEKCFPSERLHSRVNNDERPYVSARRCD